MNTDLDFYTDVTNHCIRVSRLVEAVCNELKETEMKNSLKEAALVHDIGKFYVKRSIMCAKRKLSPLEKSIVGMHTVYGYLACKQLGYREEVCQLVLLHHGIGGLFIPTEGLLPGVVRVYPILRACDIWDALQSERVYRPALSREQSVEILSSYTDIPEKVCKAIYDFSERC